MSSALLLSDSGWVAVVDDDRLLGAHTPASLHAAARHAVDPQAPATLAEHG